jgi:hypothetical protein
MTKEAIIQIATALKANGITEAILFTERNPPASWECMGVKIHEGKLHEVIQIAPPDDTAGKG